MYRVAGLCMDHMNVGEMCLHVNFKMMEVRIELYLIPPKEILSHFQYEMRKKRLTSSKYIHFTQFDRPPNITTLITSQESQVAAYVITLITSQKLWIEV